MFRPEFGAWYKLEVIVADNKEKDIIETVRKNSKIGKIFILPVTRAIDRVWYGRRTSDLIKQI